REGDALVLESPTSHARVVLHDPAAGALAASLAVASTLSELTDRAPRMPPEAVPLVLGIIADAGMVEHDDASRAEGDGGNRRGPAAGDGGASPGPLFPARPRRGRTDAPFGGTYRLAGRIDPPPPVRPIPGDAALSLFRPDLARLEEQDPPLVRVVE